MNRDDDNVVVEEKVHQNDDEEEQEKERKTFKFNPYANEKPEKNFNCYFSLLEDSLLKWK